MNRTLLILATVVASLQDLYAQNIAILDQGQNTRSTYNTPAESLFTRQYCFSSSSTRSGEGLGRGDELSHASYCPNDRAEDTTTFYAARLPRTASDYNATLGITVSETVGTNLYHGNAVSDAAYDFSSMIAHTHVQVFFESGGFNWAHNGSDRITTSSSTVVSEALDFLSTILVRDNIKAVNLSFNRNPPIIDGRYAVTEACRIRTGQSEINTLKDRGVLVFVGLPNNTYPNTVSTWPACLDNVINVGRTNPNSTGGLGTGADGIDFYASGLVPRFSSDGGNSFAAPRAAAFYALLSERFPLATIAEKLDAMKAAIRYYSFNGQTAPWIQKGDINAAVEELDQTYEPYPTVQERVAAGELIITSYDEIGPFFGDSSEEVEVEIDFNTLPVVPEQQNLEFSVPEVSKTTALTLDGRRDVVFTFKARKSGGDGYFNVYVNNSFIYQGTGSFFGTTNSVVIPRGLFSTGTNIVRVEPISTSYVWGVDYIEAKFHPIIPLTVDVTDTNEYGYLQTPKRYTGARFTVDIADNTSTYILSMLGWDIDLADETSVYINGSHLGFFNTSSSSAYGPRSVFSLPASSLRNGVNHIELVQRERSSSWSGVPDEKWAVKDIRIEVARPNLVVSDFQIISPVLTSNSPFQVTTKVQNIGNGSSQPTLVKFYTYTDRNDDSTYNLIGSRAIGSLSPNQSIIINDELSWNQLNDDYLIGACVDAVINETSIANNCSGDTILESGTEKILPPIIMLLLETD